MVSKERMQHPLTHDTQKIVDQLMEFSWHILLLRTKLKMSRTALMYLDTEIIDTIVYFKYFKFNTLLLILSKFQNSSEKVSNLWGIPDHIIFLQALYELHWSHRTQFHAFAEPLTHTKSPLSHWQMRHLSNGLQIFWKHGLDQSIQPRSRSIGINNTNCKTKCGNSMSWITGHAINILTSPLKISPPDIASNCSLVISSAASMLLIFWTISFKSKRSKLCFALSWFATYCSSGTSSIEYFLQIAPVNEHKLWSQGEIVEPSCFVLGLFGINICNSNGHTQLSPL